MYKQKKKKKKKKKDTKTILNNIDIRTETIKNPDTGGEFDVILLSPKTLPSGLKKSPLIINPHGK